MRIAVNIVALIAMGALLVAAACSEEPAPIAPSTAMTAPTPTAAPNATSVPSPTATMSQGDTTSGADPQPSPEPTGAVPDGMIKSLADIVYVQARVAESVPAQNWVDIDYDLSNTCAELYGHEEDRDGLTVTITVYIIKPSPGQQNACLDVYYTEAFTVPLGTDFQVGETYTVNVNQMSTTFVHDVRR